uniref:Uncharacterized protein n=1 Tax=Tetraselmis sp. GSL018 TaxID=582737 RepID=A0A061S2D2_9CHLO|mmetsp:Transcript_8773/g.21209  ORF Transcript_8773/g.21209 Transcript_8773/m.21209 type:complete len:147 (-) Transcript_8773:98-538(-)|eukprot:CAMPEP_0177608434 /NCGR_PEP_ID=MMETSP0419_2-20121207/18471_1 /TAXON_ID=582737 /ORGANISM="Tetraselmis sp., Strain GSL018" /LENGTH=146 /DNA_ID=CAMNT_0019103127 /DNA_START=46 /DNA_END=486 /DNA_ORIENTATION=-
MSQAMLQRSFWVKTSPAAMHRCRTSGKGPVRRGTFVVRAEENDSDAPKFSFKANDRAALGFTEQDSAGQTNIFAVEPKTYVEGTSSDEPTDTSLFVLGAFMASATLLAATVTYLTDNTVNNQLDSYKLLSDYKATFAAELASAPSL